MLSNLAHIAPLGDSELVLEMQKRRESRRLSKEAKEADAKAPVDAKEARRARAGTININWESHRPCVLGPSLSQYFRAFEEVLKVHKVKHVEQKAFDGRGKPLWLSCLC